MTETIKIRSNKREEMIDITREVDKVLADSDAKEGIVIVFTQHTTTGLTINENADPDVQRDMLHCLRTLIPQHGMGFRHGEENSDAHIKTWSELPSPSLLPKERCSLGAGKEFISVNLTARGREK